MSGHRQLSLPSRRPTSIGDLPFCTRPSLNFYRLARGIGSENGQVVMKWKKKWLPKIRQCFKLNSTLKVFTNYPKRQRLFVVHHRQPLPRPSVMLYVQVFTFVAFLRFRFLRPKSIELLRSLIGIAARKLPPARVPRTGNVHHTPL